MRVRCLIRGILWLGVLSPVCACGTGAPPPGVGVDAPAVISGLKTPGWRSSIGQEVIVEGYLVLNEDGTGRLYEDRDDVNRTSVVPQERYVALGRENLAGLDPDARYLDRVRIRAVVRETTDPDRTPLLQLLGDVSQLELEPLEPPAVVEDAPGPKPAIMDGCSISPALCHLIGLGRKKFALLYCGGIGKDFILARHWNAIQLWYLLLTTVFDYPPENVIVVYADGVPKSQNVPVDHPATFNGFVAALQRLQQDMDGNDDFFFFMTGPGGQAPDATSPVPGDEASPSDTTDEITFFYNEPFALYDDNIAGGIATLDFDRMCCVMSNEYSKGMIWDLRGRYRVFCVLDHGASPVLGANSHDELSYNIMTAFLGSQPNGQPVLSDANNDGMISVLEAYLWARNNSAVPSDYAYEDSGDGLYENLPILGFTADGAYGRLFFLD